MSDNNDRPMLAGHAPALKVGGMRVPQPRTHNETKESKPDEKEISEEEQVAQTDHNLGHLVAGTQVKDKDAFPTEAVRHYHEKQIPAHDKGLNQRAAPFHNIHQPRHN